MKEGEKTMLVKVIDLWAVANLMKSDKMKYVDISILEAEDDIPQSLWFEAGNSLDMNDTVTYDSIEDISEK